MSRLIAILALLCMGGLASASEWVIDHDNSRLGFVGTQSGGEFRGQFRDFEAVMRFDPEALDEALFDVTVDVTSFDSNSSDRDSAVAGRDWFWFSRFPKATFRTTAFRHMGADAYEAVGDLTIRNKTRKITLPFTWVVDGDTATMDGQTTLVRTHFDVGMGEWRSGKTVGLKVDVLVDLSLHMKE